MTIGFLGLHAFTGLGGLAKAATIEQLPDEEIWGVRNSFTTNEIFFAGPAAGGGRYPDAQSVPELVGPPKPKTPEQKEKEKAKCESTKIESKAEATNTYNQLMSVCASGNNTWIGYLANLARQFSRDATGYGPGSCAEKLTADFKWNITKIDAQFQACMAAADAD